MFRFYANREQWLTSLMNQIEDQEFATETRSTPRTFEMMLIANLSALRASVVKVRSGITL